MVQRRRDRIQRTRTRPAPAAGPAPRIAIPQAAPAPAPVPVREASSYRRRSGVPATYTRGRYLARQGSGARARPSMFRVA